MVPAAGSPTWEQELAFAVLVVTKVRGLICRVLVEGQASLRIVLLVIGHAAIRVLEHDRVATGAVRERGLIAGDALVRKGLEDLL